jgi:S1-C subfamily serine protease
MFRRLIGWVNETLKVAAICFSIAVATILGSAMLYIVLEESNDYILTKRPSFHNAMTPMANAQKRPVLVSPVGWEHAEQAVFTVHPVECAPRCGGTGFILRFEMRSNFKEVVATNSHVCGDSQEFILRQGEQQWRAKKLVSSKETDVCFIQLPEQLVGRRTPYVLNGQESLAPIKRGDRLAIYGHPRLAPLTFILGTYLNTSENYFPDLGAVRTFSRMIADIRPGSSGSPVVIPGTHIVVGIVFAYERFDDMAPAALFIPAVDVVRFAKDLR